MQTRPYEEGLRKVFKVGMTLIIVGLAVFFAAYVPQIGEFGLPCLIGGGLTLLIGAPLALIGAGK